MSDALVLFAGAGGSSVGIRDAGYTTVGVDNWSPALESHKAADLETIDADLIGAPLGWLGAYADVDLLWSSPPCQPFTNGRALSGRWDERDGMPSTLEAIALTGPKTVVIENVPGLTFKRHADYLAAIVDAITTLGYAVEWRILNAAEYGVPQRRRRLILIGSRDAAPVWPEPSPATLTVRDTIGDGADNPAGSRVVYLKNPVIYPGSWRGSLLYCGRGRPLVLGEPSLAIYASGGNHVHWFDTEETHGVYFEHVAGGGAPLGGEAVRGARRLTVEQMAALQAFPSGYEFSGSDSARVKQIGNAVPPPLARSVVEAQP